MTNDDEYPLSVKEQSAIKMYREWFFTTSNNPHPDFCIARLEALGFVWNNTEWAVPDSETFVQRVTQSKWYDYRKPIAEEHMR